MTGTTNIFVHEHITGGGLIGEVLPGSLAAEGRMMRDALVRDLASLPGVAVSILHDRRIEPPAGAMHAQGVGERSEWRPAFDALVETADAVWIVAPETGGVLEQLSQSVLSAERRLIGSTPAAIRIAASKRESHRCLAGADIASVPTYRPDEPRPHAMGHCVAKPDDGCGSEHTRVFPDGAAAERWIASRPDGARFVLQPYVPGEAWSLSALGRDGQGRLLCVNRQRMELRDGVFVFRGVEVNAIDDRDGVFAELVSSVVRAMPGLEGYFGIDVIVSDTGPVVVDINPRLTTSWAGLAAALGVNPAGLVLDLLLHDRFVAPASGVRPVVVEIGT